jgi:hypothetical protein
MVGMDEATNRKAGRRVFFTWFLALFGMGTAFLAFLLLATGEVGWTSPVIIALLLFGAVGAVCLVAALVSLFVRRHAGRAGGGASH